MRETFAWLFGASLSVTILALVLGEPIAALVAAMVLAASGVALIAIIRA